MDSFADIHSFNLLFNEYYNRFILFAQSYVRERPTAEDFVSEAFTHLWENRNHLSPDTNPQAYLLTIIKNRCLNHLQHIQVRQRTENRLSEHEQWRLSLSINTLQACDPEFLFSKELKQLIDETLRGLPTKTREIFILNRFDGLSYKQIAEIMKLSTKSIEFHISKALTELRISLKDFLLLLPFLFYFS
jgi:RNA polymerase sigma-70 factor (ECF subfamily)